MKTKPTLLIDSHHGVYVPKIFAKMVLENQVKVKNIDDVKKDIIDLMNIDNYWYWDIWADVLDNCILIGINQMEYTLLQNDGDLWCIPMGYDIEDFFI